MIDAMVLEHEHYTIWSHPDGWTWLCECGGSDTVIDVQRAFAAAYEHLLQR